MTWEEVLVHCSLGEVMMLLDFRGKEPASQCRSPGFDPLVGKIPWRRKWQPTPVVLSGEFYGQRSLADYNP